MSTGLRRADQECVGDCAVHPMGHRSLAALETGFVPRVRCRTMAFRAGAGVLLLTIMSIVNVSCRRLTNTNPPTGRAGHGAVTTENNAMQEGQGDGSVRLPRPGETPSASNPPRVVQRLRGAGLTVPAGLTATLWAEGLNNARVLAQAPSGEVFVTESGRDRVLVLRDTNQDQRVDATPGERAVWAEGLRLPFGIAFHPDGWVYVGCTDAVVRWRYRPGQLRAEGQPEVVVSLPGRGYNQHWTRNLVFSRDFRKVFFTVGSETNNDVEADPRRATVGVSDLDGRNGRVFASGLRNPVGIALQPGTGDVFVVVNERDGLGDGLVPDYLTRVRDGQFYGWPYAYWGQHQDPSHRGQRADLVARSVTPELSLGAHVAPVSVIFPVRGAVGVSLGDALVSLHGSWNHSQHVGYKVVRVRFRDHRPTGEMSNFITGFGTPDGGFWGRPAGLAELTDGSILLAEDSSGTIWRIANRHAPSLPSPSAPGMGQHVEVQESSQGVAPTE